MELQKRLLEINARMNVLYNMLDTVTELNQITEIEKEVNDLKEERTQLTEKIKIEARNAFETGRTVETPTVKEERTNKDKDTEERARALKQGRSISIGSLDILHIEHQSNTLSPSFNQVSHLVDLIPAIALNGGETFKKGYMKKYGQAGYTTEGQSAHETRPEWDYATINKTKITAYTEVSSEFEKLAPQMYLEEVKKNLSIALKIKLALEILKGPGDADSLTGIFSTNAKAIDLAKDIEIAVIDENTLDEIIFSYGGEEDFSPGVLILSKADLKAFSKVRGTDKKKVYEIDKKNSTIDGIPFVINSNVTPLALAQAGDYVMGYGSLNNYGLYSFSPVELSKSTDYKFREGQIAYKAEGFFGGNVISWNGFLRVKKKGA